MSQFAPPDADFDRPAAAAGQTSKLAVASLVCSLIFCCPVTTIIGVLLGLAGVAVTGSGRALRGRGMALAGLIIGLVFSGLWVVGINWGVKELVLPVMHGPREAMAAGFAGDPAGFRSFFTGPAATASDAEAQAFIDELRERYGEYQTMAFDDARGQNQQAQPGQPQATFPYTITFDNGPVEADAEIIFADQVSGQFIYKWSFIHVLDDDGDIVFPPEPDSTPEPAAGGGHDHDGDGIPDH